MGTMCLLVGSLLMCGPLIPRRPQQQLPNYDDTTQVAIELTEAFQPVLFERLPISIARPLVKLRAVK